MSHVILVPSEEGATLLSHSHPRCSVKCPPLLRTLTCSMFHITFASCLIVKKEGTEICQHSFSQPQPSQLKWVRKCIIQCTLWCKRKKWFGLHLITLCLGIFGLCGHQALATNDALVECVLQKHFPLYTTAELSHGGSCIGVDRCLQLSWEPKSKMSHVYNCLKDIKAVVYTQNIKTLYS